MYYYKRKFGVVLLEYFFFLISILKQMFLDKEKQIPADVLYILDKRSPTFFLNWLYIEIPSRFLLSCISMTLVHCFCEFLNFAAVPVISVKSITTCKQKNLIGGSRRISEGECFQKILSLLIVNMHTIANIVNCLLEIWPLAFLLKLK